MLKRKHSIPLLQGCGASCNCHWTLVTLFGTPEIDFAPDSKAAPTSQASSDEEQLERLIHDWRYILRPSER